MKINAYNFEPIKSRMYIICENEHALVIDPNVSGSVQRLLKENNVKHIMVLLTHEHCDHITGVNWLRENFDITVMCSRKCAEYIADKKKNFSEYFDILFMDKQIEGFHMEPFTCTADRWFESEITINWCGHSLYMRELPGHSPGSICIILDSKYAFTGDYLIPGQKVFTKIPGGSKKAYESITKPYLAIIKEKYTIFPGHE